eukprot:UN14938
MRFAYIFLDFSIKVFVAFTISFTTSVSKINFPSISINLKLQCVSDSDISCPLLIESSNLRPRNFLSRPRA